MSASSHPLFDRSRLNSIRVAVTLLTSVGVMVAVVPMLSGAQDAYIFTLMALPVIGTGLLMLLGPLRHERLRQSIATMPRDAGPMPCSDCGYVIHPSASDACPECGGCHVGMHPSPRWAVCGHLGEIALLLLTAVTAGVTAIFSAEFDSDKAIFWLVFFGVMLGAPLIGLPAIILQLGTRGRLVRGWIPSGLLLFAVSTAVTDWPAAAVWATHHAEAEALHACVVAGETIDLPIRLAGRTVTEIQTNPDGSIRYHFRGGGYFFRKPVPISKSPGGRRLGRLWWYSS